MAAPRIAVVGAGTSGIAMGAILARELGTKVSISVLERAPQVRDEGYGLDLDENGQLALVRAGVYHRYWDICVPQSDTYAIYNVVGEEPLARIFQPRLLQFLFPRYFAARPETNRSGMRDLLLESIEQSEGSHRVIYDCKVQGIREKADGNKSARVVELLGPNEEVIGEYDFVIDASGLHSPLRLNRVSDSEGVTFSNRAFLHGMYQNPEAVLSPELMQRIGKNGTTAVLGQGYSFFFQRYGAGPDDPRLCFFYFRTGIADENSIYQEIGFEKQTSRAAGHLAPGDPRMEKAQVWLRQDMEGAVDPIWIEAIDKLDCLTVRNEYSHGDNTSLLPNVTMPIVSIGDALCHAGLGGGGVMALQDSLELADLIVEKLTSAQYEAGKMNMRELLGPELVKKEEIMLSRKLKHRESRKLAKWLERGENFDKTNASIAFNQHPSFLFRWGMPVIARIFKWWYNLEHLVYGGVGSTQKSNIYSVVRKELKKQKTI